MTDTESDAMTETTAAPSKISNYTADEFTMKRIEKAIAKNNSTGGSIDIHYGEDTVIMAPLKDIYYALEKLQAYTKKQKTIVMESVNAYIEKKGIK